MALTKITEHVLSVDSDAVSEGSTNLFHTTARARGAVSVAGGYLTYSSGEVGLTQSNIVGSLASQSLSPANVTLSGYLRGPASFVIDPATHGNDTGTVVIAGNLQVDGTTTTINSTTMTVDDLNMVLASGAADSAAANGAGLTIDGASATMLYTHATTSFDFNKPIKSASYIEAAGNISTGANGGRLRAGGSNEMQLYFTGSHGILSSSTGNFTLDVAGEIILDADSGNVVFKDGGTSYVQIQNGSGSQSVFQGMAVDQDMIFKVNDNGSYVNALTLDASEAGYGTFNNWIKVNDRVVGNSNLVLNTSDGNEKIHLDASGYIKLETAGAERMRISSNGAVGIARTASQSNTKLEVGGADNVPLIAAEASGVFAGLGTVSAVSGTGLYVGTTLKFAVASTGAIGINGANYGTDGQVFTSGGAGAAAAWEDAGGGLPSGMTFSDGRNLGIGVTPESGWANDDNAVQVGGLGAVWGKTTAAAAKHTTLSNNVYDHPSTGQAAIVTDEGAKITLTNGTIQLTTTSAATTADAAHSWNTGLNINSAGDMHLGMTSGHHSASGRRVFEMSGTSSALIGFDINGTYSTYMFDSGTSGTFEINHPNEIYLNADSKLRFATGTNVEAMTINSSGYVGIGDADAARSPVAGLQLSRGSPARMMIHMDADTVGGEAMLQFKADSTNTDTRIKAAIIFRRDDPGTRGTGDLHFCLNGDNNDVNASTSHSRMKIINNGNVVVGSGNEGGLFNCNGTSYFSNTMHMSGAAKLQFVGGRYHTFQESGNNLLLRRDDTTATLVTFTDTGSSTINSDERFKENIATITGATAKLKQLRGVTHTWTPELQSDDPAQVFLGVIAQEVETVIPEVVYTAPITEEDPHGYKSVDYAKLVPLLIETIKELEARITTLEE